ncbi:MAG: four helix bundle protein [Anaerolineales bacterium]|nr:four helix bundle protein [Anaerolineales bacterium]
MRDFRKIQVWERAHRFTLQVYKITSSFPKDELYGLTSQMRRAAVSIPSNLAEGCGRDTQAELARFVHIAGGSASELEYQLILAHDLGYIGDELYPELNSEINEIKRMLNGFEKAVQTNVKNLKSKV